MNGHEVNAEVIHELFAAKIVPRPKSANQAFKPAKK